MNRVGSRRLFLCCLLGGLAVAIVGVLWASGFFTGSYIIDVFPGGDIQAALEAVTRRPGKGTVRVHPGTYRPAAPGQAFIVFNARHDGITLEAVGDVVLTAGNPEIAHPEAPSYPAVVNHVVYFGDGITRATTFRGFKVTGANGFVSGPRDLMTVRTADDLEKSAAYRAKAPSPIEPNILLKRTHYFYADGGGALIYGRSYPTIEAVEFEGNSSSVCAGGVSVQHQLDKLQGSVLFKDCVFRNNRAAVAGGGVDILTPGSWAVFKNCLFVGNLSNDGIDANSGPGYGSLTVFPGCRATVNRCTFASNRNGVDDRGSGSTYRETIFWRNNRGGGTGNHASYELAISSGEGVTGCFIDGEASDLLGNVSRSANTFGAPDPHFDPDYWPQHEAYRGIGFRPARRPSSAVSE
jgi:hypothetical protein